MNDDENLQDRLARLPPHLARLACEFVVALEAKDPHDHLSFLATACAGALEQALTAAGLDGASATLSGDLAGVQFAGRKALVACEGVPAHVWKLRLSGGPSEQLAAALTDSPGRRATATVADNDEADEP